MEHLEFESIMMICWRRSILNWTEAQMRGESSQWIAASISYQINPHEFARSLNPQFILIPEPRKLPIPHLIDYITIDSSDSVGGELLPQGSNTDRNRKPKVASSKMPEPLLHLAVSVIN